jgi:O-antigen ligase
VRAGGLVLLTLVIGLLCQSFFSTGASIVLKLAIAALALLALWRPLDALLIVAGVAPISRLLTARVWPANVQITEAIVLAFLLGWLIRGRRHGRPLPQAIRSPLWLLVIVTAASLLTQLIVLQAWRNFPEPYYRELATYFTRDYLGADPPAWPFWPGGLSFVRGGMLIIEGALLVWAAAALSRTSEAAARSLFRTTVLSGVAAVLLVGGEMATAFLAQGDSASLAPLLRQRWAVHVTKEVTASSHFLLLFIMALGAGLMVRQAKAAWLAAAVVIGAGVWLTGSRVGIAVGLAALAAQIAFVQWARREGDRRSAMWRRVAVVAGVCVLLVAGQAWRSPRRSTAEHLGRSVDVRLAISEAGLRMAARHPVFGVGVGEFRHQLPELAPDIMAGRGELLDAHNNYVQILSELGVAGLIPFLWLIGVVVIGGALALLANPAQPYLAGAIGGLLAFLITCLNGHPLVIGPVAYAFWIVLGLTWALPIDSHAVSSGVATPDRRTVSLAVGVGALLVIASIPFRVATGFATLDFAKVDYGFHHWEVEPTGQRYRWTGRRAGVFAPDEAQSFDLRLQPYPVQAVGPVQVEVSVDGRSVETIQLTGNAWTSRRIVLPAAGGRPRLVAVSVDPTFHPVDLIPGSRDTRELGVKVGEIRWAQDVE